MKACRLGTLDKAFEHTARSNGALEFSRSERAQGDGKSRRPDCLSRLCQWAPARLARLDACGRLQRALNRRRYLQTSRRKIDANTT